MSAGRTYPNWICCLPHVDEHSTTWTTVCFNIFMNRDEENTAQINDMSCINEKWAICTRAQCIILSLSSFCLCLFAYRTQFTYTYINNSLHARANVSPSHASRGARTRCGCGLSSAGLSCTRLSFWRSVVVCVRYVVDHISQERQRGTWRASQSTTKCTVGEWESVRGWRQRA